MSETTYREGPLLTAARTTPTELWNDSSDLEELSQSISFGAVGATCNPVIAHATILRHIDTWTPRIRRIHDAHPSWTDSQIGWQAVKDMSVEAAKLLQPIFHEQQGRSRRLTVKTYPSMHSDNHARV